MKKLFFALLCFSAFSDSFVVHCSGVPSPSSVTPSVASKVVLYVQNRITQNADTIATCVVVGAAAVSAYLVYKLIIRLSDYSQSNTHYHYHVDRPQKHDENNHHHHGASRPGYYCEGDVCIFKPQHTHTSTVHIIETKPLTLTDALIIDSLHDHEAHLRKQQVAAAQKEADEARRQAEKAICQAKILAQREAEAREAQELVEQELAQMRFEEQRRQDELEAAKLAQEKADAIQVAEEDSADDGVTSFFL